MIEKKCMGAHRYYSQCCECTRLPRTPKDEDGKHWYNPLYEKGKYCNMQIKEKK
jgi:hypothetical protein